MAPERTTPSHNRPLLDAEGRVQAKRWLENWKRVGPILDAARWARVRALSDADAWHEASMLLQWWDPEWQGDGGEGLLRQQAVFSRLRNRRDDSR